MVIDADERCAERKERLGVMIQGDLVLAFAELKRLTGLSDSELLRQGIVRVILEVKETGTLKFQGLGQ